MSFILELTKFYFGSKIAKIVEEINFEGVWRELEAKN